jgi:hypothetical protein
MHPNGLVRRLVYVTRVLTLFLLIAGLACAQAPKVGEINIYGLRKLTPEKILGTLNLKPGDPLPPSKGNLEELLAEMPGVIDARIEAVCCEGPTAALFIGVEERGAPHFDTRQPPAGDAVLPDELLERYRDFLASTARSESAQVRRLEQNFSAFAADQLNLVRDVVRNSSEPEHRACAATVLAYVPSKPGSVLNDLQYALQDADETVRAAAARSIKIIAVAGRKDPALGIKVAPVWLVEMLNSAVLGDRLQATGTLIVLTDAPNPQALALLKERAIPSLTEMARWKTLDYALPAFLLLGRTAGIPEADLHAQWEKGDRETAIRKAQPR